MSKFSENMKKYRLERKMTQRDISDITRLTIVTVNRYENDRRDPGIENAAKIANALGVTVNDLLK